MAIWKLRHQNVGGDTRINSLQNHLYVFQILISQGFQIVIKLKITIVFQSFV